MSLVGQDGNVCVFTVIDGIRSFEGLHDTELTVAALANIVKSKRAAGRARDLAVLDVLEKTLSEESRLQKGEAESSQEGE